jgi:ABC-type multidrug transport system fused ATPase/permease subunit
MLQARHFPLPIGKMRLFTSIFMAFVGGFFIFLGSTNFGWFTLTRVIYFLFGVTAGVLLGAIETRLVIPKLVKDTEAFVWQVVPIGTALFGVPLLLVMAFFGVPEYIPFGVYAFFPFITATGAASGWYFSKFEKENKVSVFMFYYGFKYWKQPNPDVSERFHHFLRDVARKDPSQFWGQLGSSLGYIGYTKAFRDKLEEKQEIDPSTRENLIKILKTMNTFRIIALVIFALFLVSVTTLMILLFGSAFGYFQFNFSVVDVVGLGSGIVLFSFFIGVIVLMKTFQRKISRLLASIDTSKFSLFT